MNIYDTVKTVVIKLKLSILKLSSLGSEDLKPFNRLQKSPWENYCDQ